MKREVVKTVNKIAILGSGISGLLAAKALKDCGVESFDIITLNNELETLKGGFMLLHDNCRMDLPREYFEVEQVGSEKLYKDKLRYTKGISSSWKSGLKSYWMVGYNPFIAISHLHRQFKDRMIGVVVDNNNINDLLVDYDTIISTIPPNNIFKGVQLDYSEIWVKPNDCHTNCEPEIGYWGRHNHPMPRVSYWGNSSKKLRSGRLWGREFSEYCEEVEGATKIIKPTIAHGLPDRVTDKIILAGRNGQWQKKILAHQVYYKICGAIRNHLIKTL